MLSRSIDFIGDKVGHITAQQGVNTLSNRAEARKRDADNRQLKRDDKMNVRKSHNYISPVDNILASLVKTSIWKQIKTDAKTRSQVSRKKGELV